MNIIEKIDKEIDALLDRKEKIQSACSHPDKSSVKNGDSGNVMTGRDPSYWVDHECNLCGKRWRDSQ